MTAVSYIHDTDTACFSVFDPKHCGPAVPKCLKLDMKVFFNSGTSDPYRMSVNSKELTEDFPENIHLFGLRLGEIHTERHKYKKSCTVENYMGFITAGVEEIRAITYEDHFFSVNHEPAPDNFAHCGVLLSFPDSKPKKSIRSTMTDELNKCFGKSIISPVE